MKGGCIVLEAVVAQGPGGRIVVMGSITKLTPPDVGAIAVSGSHGAMSVTHSAFARDQRI